MLVAVGNFFFRHRNTLFPFGLLFVLLPGPEIFDDTLDAILLGFGVAALGQLVRGTTIGFKYIIRGGRDRRVYAEDLVTEGIYGLARNPMYLGNLLIMSGIVIAANTWTCVLVAVPFFVFFYGAIVAAEERFLHDKFGAAFDAYCRDVPRWMPRLGTLRATLASLEFNWRRVIVKEYGTPFGWINAVCVAGLFNYWRDGLLTASHPEVQRVLGIMAVTFLLWATARTLKKTQVLVAD